MEAVGLGDLHYGKLDLIVPDVDLKISRAIRRVLDYALENGIKTVLQYGDIAENSRLGYTAQVSLYKTILSKKYRDLDFHFILGNHDFSEHGTHSLEVLEVVAKAMDRNVHVHIKPSIQTIGQTKFQFLPYPFTETRKDCVNVGHFEVSGSLRDNGRKIDEGYDKKHRILMGHLHTNHRVRNTHYSGTLYQTNFGEALPKYFHHVTCEADPKTLHVDSIRFEPPWKLLNVKVQCVDDLQQLTHDKDVYYKMLVKEGVDIDINKVLLDYPNIVRHNAFRNKKDLELLINKDWEFDADTVVDNVSVNELEVLTEFITAYGLNKKQVARGHAILDRLGLVKTKEKQ